MMVAVVILKNKKHSKTATLHEYNSRLVWTIIIPSILLIVCLPSHVLAMRKGRLMSPSSFTALSGDLHVQIQFSSNEVDFNTTTATTTAATMGSAVVESSATAATDTTTLSNMESIITTTLVISKYVDDTTPTTTTTAATEKQLNQAEQQSAVGAVAAIGNKSNHEQILLRMRKEIVQNIQLYPDPRHNITQIAVPCQTFTQGGVYEMQVVTNLKTSLTQSMSNASTNTARSTSKKKLLPTMTTTTLMPVSDERLRQTLDVRWPAAEMLVLPDRLRTYPEQPVEVTLRFPEVNCERAWLSHTLPEFWLELIYCGKDRNCAQRMPQNQTKSSVLYAEQIRGFPKQKKLKLRCELFGLAGIYAVQLRPMVPSPTVPVTRRFISVDWSDKFVFNVYARSIFPCDPHTGVGVLYEYPTCILDQGDRVRVYARLRADVASLKPPTSLHYVAEQRVIKSQHSLYFSCDQFSEKFVEYCFVYVSQAISGAVADVRMDCVPTLPVKDSDTGGWGPWSEWTPCSTNCLGGTRNRYRFCDSPPPRYGAKFCEGSSVETEKCGKSISDTWDCIYETSGRVSNVNRTEVNQEIGPGCRCGCIVHLGSAKPKRIIAGATQSCPGRSFWLLQVDGKETIGIVLKFLRLSCAMQYIKIRDGPSLSSTLLIELKGGNNLNSSAELESSGAQLLVEFYAGGDETQNRDNLDGRGMAHGNITADAAYLGCTGGFLAYVEQIESKNSTAMLASAKLRSRAVLQKPVMRSGFTLVHLSAVIFASIIILISALLGAQYIIRYRKYHIAVARLREQGSRLNTPRGSLGSLLQPPSRAISTTTLLSEVIYLVKMRPKHQLRHSILRESIDAEAMAKETEFDSETMMVKCDEEMGSSNSVATIRNEQSAPNSRLSDMAEMVESDKHNTTKSLNNSRSGTLKDSGKDTDSIVSSGMSSICHSPPMLTNRSSRYSDRYDASTLLLQRNSQLYQSGQDTDSLRSSCMRDYERAIKLRTRSASVSLTNGCYSPAASIVSTATIRTTNNPKESKDQQNRKKLLARPGSEFSLGNQQELELDYYDYNVTNAGAVPGSYLGMDPAYLIWIPPFDDVTDAGISDGEKTPEPTTDESEPHYEEIKMPKYGHYLSPGSNTETTSSISTCDDFSPLASQQQSKASSPSETNLKNCLVQRALNYATPSNANSTSSKPSTPHMSRKQRRASKKCQSTLSLGNANETIKLHELCGTKSARSIAVNRTATTPSPDATDHNDPQSDSYVEKETTVVKSPSDLHDFLAIDDIQFADESESDLDVTMNVEKLKIQTVRPVQKTNCIVSAV